jgi:hypothetical protein
MKQFILSALALMLVTGSALGQADLVKKKAEQIRDNNNQQQGIAPPPAPAPASPGIQMPTTLPSITAGLTLAPQALLDHFVTDAVAIKAGAAATAEQKLALANDLTALCKGGTKPAQAVLTKLAGDFSTVLTEKALANKDVALLAKNLNIILNCAPLAAARVQPLITQAQTVLKTAGIVPGTVDAIGGDLKTIVTQIQQNKPKLYQ